VDEDDSEAVVDDVVEVDVIADERSLHFHATFDQQLAVRQRRQRYWPTPPDIRHKLTRLDTETPHRARQIHTNNIKQFLLVAKNDLKQEIS